MSPRVAAIHRAVEELEHCRAKHIESLAITEKHGTKAEQGIVETFELVGHPKAKRAYAWRLFDDGREKEDAKFMLILGIPPVNSARDAVKAAIVAFNRKV